MYLRRYRDGIYLIDNVCIKDIVFFPFVIGRWVVLSCSEYLVHMCQSSSNISDVALSIDRGEWGRAQVCELTQV